MDQAMERSGSPGQGALERSAIDALGAARMDAADAGAVCRRQLHACARAAASATTTAGEDPDLQRTLAELALLCRTTAQALALGARTSRELRLICAAICHLCADQCSGRTEPWAARLVRRCRHCAESCRQVMALPANDAA